MRVTDHRVPGLRELIDQAGAAPLLCIVQDRVAILYQAVEGVSLATQLAGAVAAFESTGNKVVPFPCLLGPMGAAGDGTMLGIIEGRIAVLFPRIEGLTLEAQAEALSLELEAAGRPVQDI